MMVRLLGRENFAALANHNFRLLFVGSLISQTGTWMARTAQDWLVLTVLTDHSMKAVGLLSGVQLLPIVLLFSVAGVIADRYPKRRVLLVTQTLMALTSGVTFLLVATGTATLANIFLLGALQGVVDAIDRPTRAAFVGEVVDNDALHNAVTLDSQTVHIGRLGGPGLAGLLIASFGMAPAWGLNALSFLAVIGSLLLMRTSSLHTVVRTNEPVRFRAGLAYVTARPQMLRQLLLAFVLGAFMLHFLITSAFMAAQVFHRDAAAFGLLGTLIAAGGIASSLSITHLRRPRMRHLVLAVAAFTTVSYAAGLAPTYGVFALLMVAVGLTNTPCYILNVSLLQLATPAQLRGRVMAIFTALSLGAGTLGGPLVGWIGDRFGARWTILNGALVGTLVLAVVLAWELADRRRAAEGELANPASF